VYGFGDLEMFNAADNNSGNAFVLGGQLVSVGWFSGPFGTDYKEYSIGALFGDLDGGNHMENNLFLNKSQESGAYSIKGRLFGENYDRYGGDCRTAIGDGNYIRYTLTGSPVTGGVVLNPLMVCEDTSDTIRTVEYDPHGILAHARLRGLKGCMHTTDATNAYKLSAEGATVDINGTNHLIFSTYLYNDGTTYSKCLAISLGDWV
jgi:hypothetical protein